MAIYHLNVGHVTRTTGRSSVQSAAYITGEKLFESRRELKVSYQNRQSDIVASNTLAPDHAPDNCRELSVWDRLESFEDEYACKRFPNDEKARTKYMDSARTAMTVVVALPKELTLSVSVELIEQFAKERFVSRGLIVTYAVHDDEGNPHAHLQVSRRSVDSEGHFSWAKDRAICTRSGIRETRSVWAELANRMLEREGFEARITEKSFADLGIDLEPTEHRGWMADKLKEKGVVSRIMQENADVFERNRERLIQNPEVILDELTVHNATLTQRAILQGLQKRVGDDAAVVARCFEQALDKAVYLGMDINGLKRYTSESYLKAEQEMTSLVQTMVEKIKASDQTKSVSLSSTFAGSTEQGEAANGLLQNHALSVLIGRAGSGKTTTLKAVAYSYKQAGFKVVGTSLSALATDNLGREAGIDAYTVAAWMHRWQRYESAQEKFLAFDSIVTEGILKQKDWYRDLVGFAPFQLTDKHVLIVDEAGMLGTRQWHVLLNHAHRTGARVIAVGDDHQFTPIEAGSGFSSLIQECTKVGSTQRLNTIHRQREEWMKQASRHFAELETGDGMAMYEQHGRVYATDKAHIGRDIAARYMEISLKEGRGAGQCPLLVLAYTNEQVNELNDTIRALRASMEEIGKDLFHINGKGMAIGDVVVFTKNDAKIAEGGVYNGSRGVVRGYEKGTAMIELDDGRTARFHLRDYTHLQHGYAVTLHKSQGQTVDRVLVAASPNMDAKAVYVAMTRHRYDAELFYAKEDFKDFKTLANRLSRFENKDMAQDYPQCGFHTIRPENQEAWQRVQAYREAVWDVAASLRQSALGESEEERSAWEARSAQIALGKEILREAKPHQLYLRQAGLTEDMLKISTGMKRRILSLSEQRAKVTVELYAEVALEARSAWKNKVPSCNDLRAERDSLARVILENVPLHRTFFKENNVQFKTLQNQVRYREKMDQPRLEQTYLEKANLGQMEDTPDITSADEQRLWSSETERKPTQSYKLATTYNFSPQKEMATGLDNRSDVGQAVHNAINKKEETKEENVERARSVDHSSTLPHKQGLADEVPGGLNVKDLLKDHLEKDRECLSKDSDKAHDSLHLSSDRNFEISHRLILDRAEGVNLPLDASQCERVNMFYGYLMEARLHADSVPSYGSQRLDIQSLDQALYITHRLDHLNQVDYASSNLMLKIAMESQRFAQKSENASIVTIQQDVVIELVKQEHSRAPRLDEVFDKEKREKDPQPDASQQKLLDERSFYKAMTGKDDIDSVPSLSLSVISEMKQDMMRQSAHSEPVVDVREKQRGGMERER